jgi:hypothetical protein
MPVLISCRCGKQLRVADEYVGRRVQCPGCGEAQVVAAPGPRSAPAAPAPAATAPVPARIIFHCVCGKQLQAKSEFAGRSTRCPNCGAPVQVPAGAAADTANRVQAARPAFPTAAPPAAAVAGASPPLVKGKAGKKRSVLPWVLSAVAVLLLAGGVLLWWFLWGNRPDADLVYVPTDAQGFVSVRVADLWKSDALQKAVQDDDVKKLAEQTKDLFGLGPADVERATFVVNDMEKEEMWAIFLTAKAYKKDDLLGKIEKVAGAKPEAATAKDKTYYKVPGKDTALYFPNDRVIVVIHSKAVERFLEVTPRKKKDGALAPALKQVASGKHHLVLGNGKAADNPMIKQMRANPPEGAAPFLVLMDQQSSVFTASLGKELKVEWALTLPDANKAKEAKEALDALKVAGKAGLDVVKKRMDRDEDAKKAIDSAELGLKNLEVVQKGSEVRASTQVVLDADWIAKGARLASQDLLKQMKVIDLAPGPGGVGGVRAAAERAQSSNNLKQIALAMHNYHDNRGHLPPAVVYSPQGLPLYSWRVELLPYLEQVDLYNEWKKDEPWNGPNNSRLLSRMPAVYAMPGKPNNGMTYYKVFTSVRFDAQNPLSAPFFTDFLQGRTGPRLAGITDGTSNTILVAESATAVNWAEPRDEVFMAGPNGFPPNRLGGHHGDTILAVMFDGSVRAISRQIDPKVLQAAITHAGGEILPDGWEKKK